MGIFSKARTLTDLSTIINTCMELGKALNNHYQIGFHSSDEEWNHRSKVIDDSGIFKYHGINHFNAVRQFDEKTIKYRVQEKVGPVLSVWRWNDYSSYPFFPVEPIRFTSDCEVIHFKVAELYDSSISTSVEVIVIATEKVCAKKYSNIKLGTTFYVDGPVTVDFTHSNENHEFSMNFKIYIKLQ